MRRQKVIIITGPTASGKSALAVELASELGTEVISADSRQLYRDLPIVTAAPSLVEQRGITHHFIGNLSLAQSWSASRFEQEALRIIESLDSRGLPAVVCGGSMLYVDALRFGMDDLPDVAPDLRAALTEEWKLYGDARLRLRLLGLDPDYYARVDLDNMKRVFHAVEVSLAAGQPYSTLTTGKRKTRDFDIITICLDQPREILFERIGNRVDAMLASGLLEEAQAVYPFRGLNSLNTVGLKELFDYFDGTISMQQAIERIKKNTRVYAKKQMTWHKKDGDTLHVDASSPLLLDNVKKIVAAFQKS